MFIHFMDLDAKPYRAFIRIAELSSFSRAAESLAVSQPALSWQIKELESLLGFALFKRHNRRVSLTAEGRIFLDRAQRLMMEIEWINKAARDIRETQLRIGVAHHSGGIAERCALIEGFLLEHPEVPISVVARTHAQLLAGIQSGEFDVALTLELRNIEDNSAVERPERGLLHTALSCKRVTIAAPDHYPLRVEHSLGLDSLRGKKVASIGRAHGIGIAEYLARILAEAGAVLIHPPEGDALSVLRYSAALDCAAVDLGWFAPLPATMKTLEISDFNVSTCLSIITAEGERRRGAETFVSHGLGMVTN